MFQYNQPLININTLIENQQTFLCEFVDIKRNGWRHYSKAVNNLTYNFFSPWMDQADKQVEALAENMKLTIRLK